MEGSHFCTWYNVVSLCSRKWGSNFVPKCIQLIKRVWSNKYWTLERVELNTRVCFIFYEYMSQETWILLRMWNRFAVERETLRIFHMSIVSADKSRKYLNTSRYPTSFFWLLPLLSLDLEGPFSHACWDWKETRT